MTYTLGNSDIGYLILYFYSAVLRVFIIRVLYDNILILFYKKNVKQ